MNKKPEDNYIPALSYNFLTPFYDAAVKWTTREKVFKGKLIEQIEMPAAGRLLDLACGTGTLTIALKRKFPLAEIHGLDGDKLILGIARRKADAKGAEINFTKAFSTALPYTDNFFDVVVTSLFFHHLSLENKQKTSLEIRRVLKPGGALHVADRGKPANFLMKISSQPVIWLDGATTKDSFGGKLPELIKQAGFTAITETGSFDTFFGTIRLHEARKPE